VALILPIASRFGSKYHTVVISDSLTRVTLRKMVIRLESRFSQNDSTRVTVNDSSQSHFYKISEFLMYKPSSLHTKK